VLIRAGAERFQLAGVATSGDGIIEMRGRIEFGGVVVGESFPARTGLSLGRHRKAGEMRAIDSGFPEGSVAPSRHHCMRETDELRGVAMKRGFNIDSCGMLVMDFSGRVSATNVQRGDGSRAAASV